ncbi:hypothetical protein [Microbacterium sp. K41]|uniref:hypothetical protein n=1 Tax=Microbacterium sp. K41 TaxID=2305437 RepID=UPI001443AD04|nr:hypothetical protein [Microbacterium sp. K41]
MAEAEDRECSHCGALIAKGNHEVHREWHLALEPQLERPTTPFGFWDPQGRWTATSRDW